MTRTRTCASATGTARKTKTTTSTRPRMARRNFGISRLRIKETSDDQNENHRAAEHCRGGRDGCAEPSPSFRNHVREGKNDHGGGRGQAVSVHQPALVASGGCKK